MPYTVKEVFKSPQGEGVNIGRMAVFIRFSGCNLWNGLESGRSSAICKFCDTDFVGGIKYSADALADRVDISWGESVQHRMVVLTGGEPLLQVDEPLIMVLKSRGYYIAVETNGTRPLPAAVDWVCVSPKAGSPLSLTEADELKLVYPQSGQHPEQFGPIKTRYRWLSPMDGSDLQGNTAKALNYCMAHPEWRLALQAHKVWGVR